MATILVIDDEVAILDVASRILGKAGYTVLWAQTLASAVEAAKTATSRNERIDLILSDINLADREFGADVVKVVRETYPDAKVVYMSGQNPPKEVQTGGIWFVEKPFDPAVLKLTIELALGDKEMQAE